MFTRTIVVVLRTRIPSNTIRPGVKPVFVAVITAHPGRGFCGVFIGVFFLHSEKKRRRKIWHKRAPLNVLLLICVYVRRPITFPNPREAVNFPNFLRLSKLRTEMAGS